MTHDTSGPAFPCKTATQIGQIPELYPGMTLRQYAAIHAPEPSEEWMHMQRTVDRNRNPHNDPHKPAPRDDFELIADWKFACADAMLKQREGE